MVGSGAFSLGLEKIEKISFIFGESSADALEKISPAGEVFTDSGSSPRMDDLKPNAANGSVAPDDDPESKVGDC